MKHRGRIELPKIRSAGERSTIVPPVHVEPKNKDFLKVPRKKSSKT